jgi:hypothetical protein
MAAQTDGFGIASVAIGIVFIWGGVKGYSPLKAAENIIQGKNPNEGQTGNSLVASSTTTDSGTTSGGGAVQATYTNSQLQSLWIANGGDPGKASVAACIGMHESSGRASATSSNPDGGTNVGIWQLDTKGVGSGHTVAQLSDPNTNAKLAIVGSKNGTDWRDWSTAPLCGA